jgi:hypothetical protein
MKTVVKRINPAFTVVQPLPLWPVTVAAPAHLALSDRRAGATQLASLPETIPATLCAAPARREFSHRTAAN